MRKLTEVLSADWTFARVAERKEVEHSRPLKAGDEDSDDPKSQQQSSCSTTLEYSHSIRGEHYFLSLVVFLTLDSRRQAKFSVSRCSRSMGELRPLDQPGGSDRRILRAGSPLLLFTLKKTLACT